jgi:hypothetical protein
MKLRQQARVLKRKALMSFITAAEAFNSPRDDGRGTKVLLHLQHGFEMLLKAALFQAGKPVFDQAMGRSIGFESCVKLAMNDATIKLSDADAGTLRAIDAMRDDEQHWFNEVSEQLLYLHVRAAVTLFDDIHQRDLQKKYHRSAAELASAVGLSRSRAVALRRHLGIDADESCRHDFEFGSQCHPRYSDNAFTKMREAKQNLDMDAIWQAHRPQRASTAPPACPVTDCKAS